MTKRGRILRDTNSGPGLLTVEGKQYSFLLEGMWRSEVPPRAGMPVNVQFNSEGVPEAVLAVSDGQVAREQADQALADVKRQGGELARKTFHRFGVSTVIAFVALLAGWFLFTTLSFGAGAEGMDVTFWRLLGYVNDSHAIANLTSMGPGISPTTGAWGLFALLALAGTLLRYFWPDKRANLAAVLPLLVMILAFIVLRSHALSAGRSVGGWVGPQAAERIMTEFMKHISFGLGLYIALLSSLYFSFVGLKGYLAGRA